MKIDTITNDEIDIAVEKTIVDNITSSDTIKTKNIVKPKPTNKDPVYTGPCKVCGHKITGGKIVDGKTSCPVCTTDN